MTYMTKSMPPSSLAHRSAAACRLSIYITVSIAKAGNSSVSIACGTCPYLADIAPPNSDYLCPQPHCGNVLGHGLSLLNVAPDNTRVGSQPHQRACLHAANCASTARNKGDATLYVFVSAMVPFAKGQKLTEDVIPPHGAQILGLGDGHGTGN